MTTNQGHGSLVFPASPRLRRTNPASRCGARWGAAVPPSPATSGRHARQAASSGWSMCLGGRCNLARSSIAKMGSDGSHAVREGAGGAAPSHAAPAHHRAPRRNPAKRLITNNNQKTIIRKQAARSATSQADARGAPESDRMSRDCNLEVFSKLQY